MRKLLMLVSGVTLLAAIQSSAVPQRDFDSNFFDRGRFDRDLFFRARLTGFNETPSTLSSPAKGEFLARVGRDEISYRLVYWDLPTSVLFAHIHFGAAGTTGGVAAFLCGGAPPQSNKAACPSPSAVVTGTITPSDIIGPTGQGIAAGEFDEIVRALRKGFVYANVHTTQFPGGEIRGQALSDNDD